MKRRNADCGKIRRPIKRNKITEGMYGNTTILYLKFLILWAIVITADFMFMFRFEFLWPFWLLLRSVHDSFKYKGLAFSVLFVCIAITSDLVCLFFIPVHWLLFAASTYVWVQYVWHTDKGICLPTIILWMLFVYLEAGIRWKDTRHMPHLDLCRPFAAHCIGYPVVTLGFGFKSYVGYKMRQRKQREVAKENEFYMQLLLQALPQEENDDSKLNLTNEQNGIVSATQTAQILHNNSVAVENNTTQSTSATSTVITSTTTSVGSDDKTYVQLVGPTNQNSSQTSSATFHQNPSSQSNHVNHNNLNSNHSSSSNKIAQIKLNLLCNNAVTSTSSSSTTATMSTTANGHAGNNNTSASHKNSRRSVDKEKNHTNDYNPPPTTNHQNHKMSNSSKDHFTHINPSSGKMSNNNYQVNDSNHVQKENWENGNFVSSSSSSSSVSGKDKLTNNSNNYETTNGNIHNNSTPISDNSNNQRKTQVNGGGNSVPYEVEHVEPVEKVKGKRNRSKKDNNNSSKDNHHSHHNNNNNNNNININNTSHHNHHVKDINSDASSTSSSTSSTVSTTAVTSLAAQVVKKICENCLKLEADVKKYRTEISHMKQFENELKQKLEANLTTKTCLQAKQKDYDELDKKYQDVTNTRQIEFMNLQNAERRYVEERRQRQSFEAQLNNEKKARKLAEDKANRPECSEACKQRKQQIECEAKQLRRDLKIVEEAKQMAEQQGRKFEQELRMFEAEIRSRDTKPGAEMLMSALAAMQDKNSNLEKNLSAETRVKLDLFSALGEAKRQLEIKDNMLRSKQDEVLDLKAKIAQLLAVMPTDTLCLPSCSSTGGAMLRMNDTPPLQGPSSPMMGMGAAAAAAHQQLMSGGHPLNARGGVQTSVNSQQVNVASSSVVGQSSSQTSSNLDPNATAYTPKNSSMVGGGNDV